MRSSVDIPLINNMYIVSLFIHKQVQMTPDPHVDSYFYSIDIGIILVIFASYTQFVVF